MAVEVNAQSIAFFILEYLVAVIGIGIYIIWHLTHLVTPSLF